jgi:hypothetical protein
MYRTVGDGNNNCSGCSKRMCRNQNGCSILDDKESPLKLFLQFVHQSKYYNNKLAFNIVKDTILQF